MNVGRSLPEDIRVVVAKLGDRLRIETGDARPVRRHSNAVVMLPSAGLVVRIAGNPDALDKVAASVAVTRWLGERGFPCVRPAHVEQPLVVEGRVVSVWRSYDVASDPEVTGRELGRLLRVLHAQPRPPLPLRELTDPLESVARAIECTPDALPGRDRSWLIGRIDELRGRWRSLDFMRPYGLVHGDAHPNNVMRLRNGETILGDWDHTAIGPREWDLVQLHYMRRRFDRLTHEDVEHFAAAYGRDIRDWDGLGTLIEVREISGLSPYIRSAPTEKRYGREVARRLRALRDGDEEARWSPPADLT